MKKNEKCIILLYAVVSPLQSWFNGKKCSQSQSIAKKLILCLTTIFSSATVEAA
jgi:hypothetical protein